MRFRFAVGRKESVNKIFQGFVSQWRVTELKKFTEILDSYKTPGFHAMIVADRSRLLGLLVNCSAIVANFVETKFSFWYLSPTIPATAKDHWDRIRVYLRDRSDCEGSSAISAI